MRPDRPRGVLPGEGRVDPGGQEGLRGCEVRADASSTPWPTTNGSASGAACPSGSAASSRSAPSDGAHHSMTALTDRAPAHPSSPGPAASSVAVLLHVAAVGDPLIATLDALASGTVLPQTLVVLDASEGHRAGAVCRAHPISRELTVVVDDLPTGLGARTAYARTSGPQPATDLPSGTTAVWLLAAGLVPGQDALRALADAVRRSPSTGLVGPNWSTARTRPGCAAWASPPPGAGVCCPRRSRASPTWASSTTAPTSSRSRLRGCSPSGTCGAASGDTSRHSATSAPTSTCPGERTSPAAA